MLAAGGDGCDRTTRGPPNLPRAAARAKQAELTARDSQYHEVVERAGDLWSGSLSDRSRYLKIAYVLLCCLLAVVHLCQTIVFTHGSRIPGGGGDARLNNLIFEHTYHALRGHYALFSPGQFYPTDNALAFSDNHLGTFLVYSLFRRSGLSTEGAFQGWQLAMAALNAAGAVYLMASLRVVWWLIGPFAFISTSHFMLAGKLGHPQVLPFFPFLFCLGALVRFFLTPRLRYFVLAVLSYTYIHYCYLYYGYLSTIVLGIWVCIVTSLSMANIRSTWRTPSRVPVLAGFTIVASCAAALAYLYMPYHALVMERGWTNPPELVAQLAPTMKAWFTAQRSSLWYGHWAAGPSSEGDYEKRLFTGLVLTMTPAFGIVTGVMLRAWLRARVVLALALTTMTVILVFTTFGDHSIYLLLADRFAFMRAFRAFGRVAYLLLPILGATLAAALTCMVELTSLKARRALAMSLAVMAVLEGMCVRQRGFSYDKRPIQGRVADLAATIGARRSQSPFALTLESARPGLHEGLHLDAWQVAMELGRKCVNGYSGSAPAILDRFLRVPTIANLDRALIAAKVPMGTVEAFAIGSPDRLPQFARMLPSRTPGNYEWGDTIVFSEEGTADEYMIRGFSWASGEWRWTNGYEAEMRFMVRHLMTEDVHLRFTAIPFIAKRIKEQIVSIRINNHAVTTLRLRDPAAREYEVIIPEDVFRESGSSIQMDLALPNASVPADLGVNNDARRVGIAISRMSISAGVGE